MEKKSEEAVSGLGRPRVKGIVDFRQVQKAIYENARNKGFWDSARNDGEAVALMHSELSEALEAMRQGNPASKVIQGFSSVEEEFADTVIRMMDFCEGRGWDFLGAILSKHEYNTKRPFMHGKKF